MAIETIYRAAYIIDDREPNNVHFSEWVTISGIEDKATELASMVMHVEGNPVSIAPTVIGWEAKKLDTEPI